MEFLRQHQLGVVAVRWPVMRYSFTREFLLERRRVWELLGDTDHLNRVIRLFPIDPGPPRTDGGELYREMSARAFGLIPIKWKEYPFEWIRQERYHVVRVYSAGPFARVDGGIELADADTRTPQGAPGTRLTVYAEFTPAGPLGLLAAMLEGKASVRRTLKYVADYMKLRDSGRPDMIPQLSANFDVNRAELERALGDLRQSPVDLTLVDRLGRHLLERGDDEVAGIRPFELARRWQADRDGVLRLFLYATKAGVVKLSWSLICPNCRVQKEAAETLLHLPDQFHCDLCAADIQVNFDRQVELRFDVHPAIRRASYTPYCISGPELTPHILQQQYVEQGSSDQFRCPDLAEPWRLRVLRLNHMALVRPDEAGAGAPGAPAAAGAPAITLALTPEGFTPDRIAPPAPGTILEVANRCGFDAVVVLEHTEWDPDAVTAARVTAMQEFRTLFSSEVLAPGQEVGVESVTILFSDLLGSTFMYEIVGDASAYGRVRRHFDYMMGYLSARQGSLVKTIGDAVMAVFYAPEDGVRAALDIQANIDAFNASLPEGSDPIVIKIGLHHGPAIAINANDRLDYFGRTVNIAARVQRESKGGDLVMSRECYDRPAVRAVLSEYGVEAELYPTVLKGIEGQVEVARVWVPRPQPARSGGA